MRRRVILASNSFNERGNYMEVVAAAALARPGCDVLIVTIDHRPSGKPQPWKVARVTRFMRIRDTVFFPRGLDEIVRQFKPEAAFLFAPNHGLSYALHRH